LKIVNIARLKQFVEEAKNRFSQDDSRSSQVDQRLNQDNHGLFQDQQDQPLSRPMTRAFKKLTDLKNAASMAISLLANIDAEECYGNIFCENFDKNHCSNCQNDISDFLKMPNLKRFLQKFYVGPMCSTELIDTAAKENLIKNDADPQKVELLLKETKNNVHSKADLLT
jgi:hypothetical protein